MRCFFLPILLMFTVLVFGQEKKHELSYHNVPLSDVLSDLESRFQVKFSYNSAAITDINITVAQRSFSLKQLIAYIEEQVSVVFEPIDARYYIVKKKLRTTVCGYLKDGFNASAIADAGIQLAGTNRGTITDENGYFEIMNVAPTDSLLVSFIGYRPLVIPLKKEGDAPCPTHLLFSDNLELNEVIVREYLASGIQKTRDGAVAIRPTNLDILSGLAEPDVLQHTQLLPGIESPSETAAGLFIRGGSPDQNLILWDGIKMYGSDHFFGTFSAFNPYITEEVKIYRSGAKSRYGDHVSGVVDMRTDSELPTTIGGGAGVNMTHADAFLKIPVAKNLGVLVAARRSLTDVFRSPTFNQFSKKVFQNTSISTSQETFDPDFSEVREDFYFTDMTLKAMAHISEKDQITLSNIYTKNSLDYALETLGEDQEQTDKLSIENLGSSVEWKRTWRPTFQTNAQVFYSQYDFRYEGRSPFFDETLIVNKTNHIEEVGARLHTDLTLGRYYSLSNGYQFFSNRVDFTLENSFFDDIESDAAKNDTHALYSELSYANPENWHFDLGFRLNRYSVVDRIFFEPRLYIERKLGAHFRAKASAEIKNQSVSQVIEFETDDFGLENQIWVLANDDETPILASTQFSGGLLFSNQGWHLDMDAYYKKINGLTSFTRGFEAIDGFSKGRSVTTGIDMLLKKKIGAYTTWLGYTFSNTDFTFDSLNQGRPFSGNNDIAHSLTWSHFYEYKNLQFSLGWKLRTGIPFTAATGISDDEDASIRYSDINALRLPGYHRLDLSLLYDFDLSKKNKSTTGKVGISLLNLYGRKNLLNRTYRVDFSDETLDFELQEIDRFSLGITPNLFFRVAF